ncbi:hypothetical protein H7J55_02850 [Mycolicibacterium brisbanense]|nr:hypothetical protein [Mycolicibacterium brisbanense]
MDGLGVLHRVAHHVGHRRSRDGHAAGHRGDLDGDRNSLAPKGVGHRDGGRQDGELENGCGTVELLHRDAQLLGFLSQDLRDGAVGLGERLHPALLFDVLLGVGARAATLPAVIGRSGIEGLTDVVELVGAAGEALTRVGAAVAAHVAHAVDDFEARVDDRCLRCVGEELPADVDEIAQATGQAAERAAEYVFYVAGDIGDRVGDVLDVGDDVFDVGDDVLRVVERVFDLAEDATAVAALVAGMVAAGIVRVVAAGSARVVPAGIVGMLAAGMRVVFA